MTNYKPESEEEAAAIVREALEGSHALRIVGGGTRQQLGRATQTAAELSTTAMSGITLYEPAEMVLSAKAGTPLSEIQKALDENGQMLTFEPMDHRTLLGTSGEPTIGSIVAGNISGPRRIFAGAMRDSLIGVRFVNGKGEIIKNGGRVMKNVTGLDLVKLQAGAWGTLGLLTEVTFKLLPKPEREVTMLYRGLDDVKAVDALCAAHGTPFEVTGTSHLPAGVGEDSARTVIRVEGFKEQVDYRINELKAHLADYGSPEILESSDHYALWQAIRDCELLAEPRENAIWRLSVRPTDAPAAVAKIKAERDCDAYYDWSGGLIWLSTSEADDAGAGIVRKAAKEARGYATLVRASASLRAVIDVFEPQPAPLAKLSQGIKESFDPAHILNPGLMVA